MVHHHLPRYNWAYRYTKFSWIAELVIPLFSTWDFTLCGESVRIMFYFWGGQISKSMTLRWSLVKNWVLVIAITTIMWIKRGKNIRFYQWKWGSKFVFEPRCPSAPVCVCSGIPVRPGAPRPPIPGPKCLVFAAGCHPGRPWVHHCSTLLEQKNLVNGAAKYGCSFGLDHITWGRAK